MNTTTLIFSWIFQNSILLVIMLCLAWCNTVYSYPIFMTWHTRTVHDWKVLPSGKDSFWSRSWRTAAHRMDLYWRSWWKTVSHWWLDPIPWKGSMVEGKSARRNTKKEDDFWTDGNPHFQSSSATQGTERGRKIVCEVGTGKMVDEDGGHRWKGGLILVLSCCY